MLLRRMRVNVEGIEGLTYVPDYLSKAEEADLRFLIDREAWSTELKRRVQHYGYRYDYRRRQAGRYLGRLPGWLMALADRMRYDGLITTLPDQCAINEYLPGQGISPHIDSVPSFGDTVLSLSLGSSCVMEFSRPDYNLKIPVLVQPRSLLVMTGAARYQWRHSIPARKTDHYDGMDYLRERRLSITFRKMLLEEVVVEPAYAAPQRKRA